MVVREPVPGKPGLFRNVVVPDPVPSGLPCKFVGDDAGPKGFHICDHPDTPLGLDIVCTCQGCGPRCPGYTLPEPPVLTPARPRVLFASHDLTLTGAPTILANLIPHLRGIDPVVYSPHDGPLRARFERSGIPVTFALDLGGVAAVVANSLPSAPVVAAARDRDIPCVWLIHESAPDMCGNLPDVLDVIRYPRHVVFPSHATAAAWSEIRRGPVIYSTVPPVPRLPRNVLRPFVVLSVGSDEPRKGQADIRAAVEGMHGVELVTVSGKEDVHSYYAAADLYVCSSRVEAFPLAIQEAKSHGLPVITTPVYGCREIIRDGIDGLHYEPGDVEDLRAKIQAIRTNADLCKRLSQPLTHLPTFDESVRQYESLIHEVAGVSPVTPPVRVVYHSAGGWGPWWRDVVREQFALLARVGLREILGTHNGWEPEWVQDEAARHSLRYTLCEYNADLAVAECPAMRLIERLCRNSDVPILYLHSKGVSHDPEREPVFHDWRRLMERELVERWREHLPRLADRDLVGVNWWPNYPHFSGNFWLTRADWVRKLPRFDSVYRDRYTCERWIGMMRNPRVESLVCTDRKLWVKGPHQDFLYAALATRTPAAG